MAKDRMENLEDAISTRLGRSGALLERMGVTHESFFRTVIHALVTSKKRVKPGRKSLADCTPDSVDLALIKCLNAGLMPDGEEVLLKPRTSGKGKDATTECSVELGIVGKLKQAYKASPGIEIWARTVWEDDEFEHTEGLSPDIVHKPARGGRRGAEHVICVYACFRMLQQRRATFEVLYRPDIDRHRAFSANKDGITWTRDYHEMAERSALGLVLKRAPKRADDIRDEGVDDPFGAADDEPAAAVPALEHQPSRTLQDAVPGKARDTQAKGGLAAAAAEGATARRARAAATGKVAPSTLPAEPAPPPAEEAPPIEAYNEDKSPF